ncbi:MAG: hypothetical protein ABEH43_11405, partial [Flavobacteriales bacterium]
NTSVIGSISFENGMINTFSSDDIKADKISEDTKRVRSFKRDENTGKPTNPLVKGDDFKALFNSISLNVGIVF